VKLRSLRAKLKIELSAILFLGVLIWMTIALLFEVPAMAFHTPRTHSILQGYESVVRYEHYAYGTRGTKEAVAHEEHGIWKILCESDAHLKGVDIVNQCQVPVGIARHLKVLQTSGINHELFVKSR
jgi:hypothetical protein